VKIVKKNSTVQLLYLVLIIIISSFCLLTFLEYQQLKQIVIKGPLYKEIAASKDVTADVLPPPLFIVESYMLVLKIAQESDPAEIKKFEAEINSLRKKYNEQLAYWNKQNINPKIQEALNESSKYALNFYKILITEFIPTLKLPQNSIQKKNILSKLGLVFEAHRAEIDNVVIVANENYRNAEANSDLSLKKSHTVLLALIIFFLSSLIAFYLWIIRIIKSREEIQEQNIELQQIKDELTKRSLQLEQSNKELEAFSYSVSHDLRSPLRGINGWTVALREDYDSVLDERAKGYIDQVTSEALRMGDLIDDLIKLAKIARSEVVFQEVNLSKLAEKICVNLKREYNSRHIEVNIQKDMFARCDSHFMDIALTNLLSNAFKFTGNKDRARIDFGKTQENGLDVFYIKDNGAGFEMSYANKLFEPFQRLHHQADFPGSGIGLATVKRIITLHHGKIWCESIENQETKFFFTLQHD
jgi:signal transduction histidine kinase